MLQKPTSVKTMITLIKNFPKLKRISCHILLFLTVFISCKKGEREMKLNTIPKDETLSLKYEVLNQLIKNDSINYELNNLVYNKDLLAATINNEIGDERPLGIDLKYDSIFMEKDSTFYKLQEKINFNFKLDQKMIKTDLTYVTSKELSAMIMVDRRDFWNRFNKKFKNKCLRVYSVPFFNKEKTLCVVQNSTSCGILAADGFTAIYKKIKGKWTVIRSYDHWIS